MNEAEASSRPISGYIRGPNGEWIAQQLTKEEAAKEATAAAAQAAAPAVSAAAARRMQEAAADERFAAELTARLHAQGRPPAWPETLVHVGPGSQYSAKVLAALDSRGIPHYANFQPLRSKKRKLPSRSRLVPQAEITYHAKAGYRPRTVIVPDSDAILRRTGSPMRCRCRTRPAGSLALRLCSVLCAILYRQPQSSTLDIVIRQQT